MNEEDTNQERTEQEHAREQRERLERLKACKFEVSDDELIATAEAGLLRVDRMRETVKDATKDGADPAMPSADAFEAFNGPAISRLRLIFIEYRQYLRAPKIWYQAAKLAELLSPQVELSALEELWKLQQPPLRRKSLKTFIIERTAAAIDPLSGEERNRMIRLIFGNLTGRNDATRGLPSDVISHALEGTPYARKYWRD